MVAPFASRLAGSDTANIANYQTVNFHRLLEMAWLARRGYDKTTPTKTILDYELKDILSDDQHDHCRIYINKRNQEIILAFEGSDPTNHIHTQRNLNVGRQHPFTQWKLWGRDIIGAPKMVVSPFGVPGKVHPGFAETLFGQPPAPTEDHDYSFSEFYRQDHCFAERIAQECLQCINEQQDKEKWKVSFTGHSAGGALALLMASYVSTHYPNIRKGEIYTFGTPRTGGKHFIEELEKAYRDAYFRCEILGDPVPAWPRYEEEYYVHGGQQIVLTQDGKLLPSCKESNHHCDSYASAYQGAADLAMVWLGLPPPLSVAYHIPRQYTAALTKAKDRKNTALASLSASRQAVAGTSALNESAITEAATKGHSMIGATMDRSGNQASNFIYYFSDYVYRIVGEHIEKTDMPEEARESIDGLRKELKECTINKRSHSQRQLLEQTADTLWFLYFEVQAKAPLPQALADDFRTDLLAISHYLQSSQQQQATPERR